MQIINTGGAPSEEEATPVTQAKAPPKEPWQTDMTNQLVKDAKAWAEDHGVPAWEIGRWLRDQMNTYYAWVMPYVLTDEAFRTQRDAIPEGMSAATPKGTTGAFINGLANPYTQPGIDAIYNLLKSKIDLSLPGFAGGSTPSPSGGYGGGYRAPTAGEIRQQFDMDKLTADAQKLARAYLVEDLPDPRGIASAYVNAIVASGGKQNIDYQTFVTERLKKTARWTQIQRGNSEGIDPLEYVSQYATAALAALGGNRGEGISDVVGEGAALGAAPGAFNDRLMREDAVRNQTGFINGLEQRLGAVNKVLRG
jgi:hypothetical protein